MILAEFGAGALLAGVVLALFAAAAGFWASRRDDARLAAVARRSLYAAAAMVLIASSCLLVALLSHDFAIAFVAEHSDLQTPAPLLAAAFYGGQAGSLLYWALVLSVVGSAAVAAARGAVVLRAGATALVASVLAFFLLVLVFVASPFEVLSQVPPDGLGLNPLLRDGGMLVHPPFLLAGFASFAIPFAFAGAALLTGRFDPAWIAQARRYALLAWGLQGVGLTLGMWWAYHVLGWGGYWGWDPVENVALLPWLATTAYIHSSQVQERRGMLKAWNFGLLMLAFCLAIFGTFVVRSGVIQSVHSFALSNIGPWFFGFLAVVAVLSTVALAARSRLLRADRQLEAPVSREGAFLLNNLLLLGLTFAVFWGTILPLGSELLTGQQAVVGPGFYERVASPLFLALLALLAVGPLLPWRRPGRGVVRRLTLPLLVGAGAFAGLLGSGIRSAGLLAALSLILAAASTAVGELARAIRVARRPGRPFLALAGALVMRNRRRYGAHLAHLGILVVAAGIAGSHLLQQERQVVLAPGQSVAIGRYQLQYSGTAETRWYDRTTETSTLWLGNERLEPARTVYPRLGGQSSTQVAIRSTPVEDLYVVLAAAEPGGSATVLLFVNPMVTWIWAGAALLVTGVLFGNLSILAPEAAPARGTRRRAVLVGGE